MGLYTGKSRRAAAAREVTRSDPLGLSDPQEVKKMKGGWTPQVEPDHMVERDRRDLMTYLYATALRLLYSRASVKSGLEIPIQIATIVGGIFGPVFFAVFLSSCSRRSTTPGCLYRHLHRPHRCGCHRGDPRAQEKRLLPVLLFVVGSFASDRRLGFTSSRSKNRTALLFVATRACCLRGLASIQILYVTPNTCRSRSARYRDQAILWFTFISGVIVFHGMYATYYNV